MLAKLSVMSKQFEKSQRMQRRIMDAVIDVIYEHGYASTTLKRILTKADVSQGTLQHHFPTKEVLLADSVGHLATKTMLEFMTTMRKYESAQAPIASALTVVGDIFSSKHFYVSLELIVASRTDEALRNTLEPIHLRMRAAIEALRPLASIGAPYNLDDLRRDTVFHVFRSLALDRIFTGEREVERNFRSALNALLFPDGWDARD